MVEIEFINTENMKVGPYSHATKMGNLIFISGQIPDVGLTDIESQTNSAFKKIKDILEVAGSKVTNILKVTVFLKNIKEFEKMNQVYVKFFEDNGIIDKFPARTTVEISNLPKSDIKIEIDVIATI